MLLIRRNALYILISTLLFSFPAFALDAVDISVDQLGKPYWEGFEGPDLFDCSGLIWYAYTQTGFTFPRTTSLEQSQQLGILVTDALQRGDLLFFETDDEKPGVVTHVGIYEGNNMMINAVWYNIGVVRSNITSSYWSPRFLFARRILSPPNPELTITINFDTFPDGSTIPEVTRISDQYKDNGVLFSIADSPQHTILFIDNATAETNSFYIATSAPNVLGTSVDPGPMGGTMGCNWDLRIDFIDPISESLATTTFVSITVLALTNSLSRTIALIAKDINGVLVDRDEFVVPQYEGALISPKVLTTESNVPNIVSVRTEGGVDNDICLAFDDLKFKPLK